MTELLLVESSLMGIGERHEVCDHTLVLDDKGGDNLGTRENQVAKLFFCVDVIDAVLFVLLVVKSEDAR